MVTALINLVFLGAFIQIAIQIASVLLAPRKQDLLTITNKDRAARGLPPLESL